MHDIKVLHLFLSFHLPFTNIWHMRFKVPSYDFICNVYLPFTIFSNQNFPQKWWDIHGVLFVYLLFFLFFFLLLLICFLGFFFVEQSILSIYNNILVKFSVLFRGFQSFCSQESPMYRLRMMLQMQILISVLAMVQCESLQSFHYGQLWVINSSYSIFAVAKQTFLG